jgi:hypothetical protein
MDNQTPKTETLMIDELFAFLKKNNIRYTFEENADKKGGRIIIETMWKLSYLDDDRKPDRS